MEPISRYAAELDFAPRQHLDGGNLVRLFSWSEEEFHRYTEGTAIRRIGYECWLRNLAVALGNAPTTAPVIAALEARGAHPSALVAEHVAWALRRHRDRRAGCKPDPDVESTAGGAHE